MAPTPLMGVGWGEGHHPPNGGGAGARAGTRNRCRDTPPTPPCHLRPDTTPNHHGSARSLPPSRLRSRGASRHHRRRHHHRRVRGRGREASSTVESFSSSAVTAAAQRGAEKGGGVVGGWRTCRRGRRPRAWEGAPRPRVCGGGGGGVRVGTAGTAGAASPCAGCTRCQVYHGRGAPVSGGRRRGRRFVAATPQTRT